VYRFLPWVEMASWLKRLLAALKGPSRTWLASAQLPRNGCSFVLIQKNQNIKSEKRLLCRTWPLPCRADNNHGAGSFCRLL
jgi:hypothetical protein